MSELKGLSPSEIRRGVQLIRSPDPEERKRGIHILIAVRHDPRVLEVFERLYEDDTDPGVRREAWHALTQTGPAVPAPAPDPGPVLALVTAGEISAPQERARPALFLLDPANARIVARETKRASRKKRRRVLLTLAAGLLLPVMAVLWGLVLPGWFRWYRLHEEGVSTGGQIAGLRVRSGDRYYAAYRFEVGQGSSAARYTGEQRVTAAAYVRLAEGASVTVTYWPDDPHVSRLDDPNPDDQRREWLTLAATALSLLVVALALLGLDQRSHSRRVQRGGRVLRGQVIESSGRVDEDGDFKIRLRYRFRASGGQVIDGQTSQIRNDLKDAPLPPPGAPVAVYYRHDGVYRLL